MDATLNCYNWELVVAIVNPGQSSRVIRIGKSVGVKGGTVVLAHGTARQPLLQFLELADVRKEIVLMVADTPKMANATIEALDDQLKMHKKNHGIAFTVDVSHFIGTGHFQYCDTHESEDKPMKHQVIFTILDKGKAEDAMKIASEAGAHGGTIINARGSGIHETQMIFQMAIEPEKEILMIVSDIEKTEAIVEAIKIKMEIEKPGNGIIFVQDVKNAIGLSKSK